MKSFWSILIIFLLLLLITLVLFSNKKETDFKIEFAEREVEILPVRVSEVTEGTIDKTLTFTDIIKPTLELMINAPVQGRILKVYVKEGSAINKNELLIKTDDDYIQAEFEVDKQNYELAKKNLNRVEKLDTENALPKNQYEQIAVQAESAEIKMAITEKRINETWVRSPTGGFLNQLFVKEGMLINPSVPIGEVVDISKFKVVLFINEQEVKFLKKGMEAGITIDGSSEKFKGTISSVAHNADFALQYKVVIEFTNTTDWLKGGMVCKVVIIIKDEESGIIVPVIAVVHEDGKGFIYKIENGIAVKQSVSILGENNNYLKVNGDIKQGDMVVVEGQTKLSPGVKVNIIENK